MGCGSSKADPGPPKANGATAGGGTSGAAEKPKKAAESGTPGKLLDKYTLGKVLGQGAFGVVYSCTLKNGSGTFAVKMIDKVESPIEDIKREVAMLQKLEHPTVVKLWDVYFEKVFVYMVMELYKGGDMIEGMQAHWKTKGQIPVPIVQKVTKQMLEGIAWCHKNNVVHRDVKGDNYLMKVKDISASENQIFLSDFGTVVDLLPEARLKATCGTKVYWSPEFYSMNYSHKVDVWAVGVVLFGLLTGRFPFNGEKDVRQKQVKLPKARCSADGEKLVLGLLAKDEKERLDAKSAVEHAWLSSIPSTSPQETIAMEEAPNIEGYGANGGVAERRAELVARLENAHEKVKLNVAAEVGDKFTITDKGQDEKTQFEWWPAAKVKDQKLINEAELRPETQEDQEKAVERNTPGIMMMLKEHIDTSKFGQGDARSIEALVQECQVGQSQLMLDATAHKRVVRVVDIVLLRIKAGNKYLLQISEKYSDGRERKDVHQIPGTKKLPHENAMQTAMRVLETRLQMPQKGFKVGLNPRSLESYEEEEDSPHFPGLKTVYRKEIIEGTVTTGSPNAFDSNDCGNTYGWDWFEESKCLQMGAKLRSPKETGEISALVQAPVGFDEEVLSKFLDDNKVDKEKFGQGQNVKTLKQFSDELTKGEATLANVKGKVVRVVDVVVLKLVRADGCILVETECTGPAGTRTLNRLPAVKRKSDENQFYSATRVLRTNCRLDPNTVNMDAKNVGIVEEAKDSPSYPGVSSVYKKRIITASVATNK
jgi:hypothetical protein